MPSNFYSRWMDRVRSKHRKRATLQFFNLGLSMKRAGAANSDVTEGALRGLLMLYDVENDPSRREAVLRDLQAHIRQSMAQLP